MIAPWQVALMSLNSDLGVLVAWMYDFGPSPDAPSYVVPFMKKLRLITYRQS